MELNLDHSCDEWVIGGIESGVEMIKNLQEAVKYCKTLN